MSERQSGQTSAQMQNAPIGALFLWCNDHLQYPRELARSLGRSDLRIIGLATLRYPVGLMGQRCAVVVDHAAPRTSALDEGYQILEGVNRAFERQTCAYGRGMERANAPNRELTLA